MSGIVRPRFWAHFFSKFQCQNCGSAEGYVSRPRTLFESYALPMLFLRSARCGDCYRRTWRPLTVPLHPRKQPKRFAPEAMVARDQSGERREPQKETDTLPQKAQRIA
jgi:hypothetical protein